jgi:nucleoid-associated protein YgaU
MKNIRRIALSLTMAACLFLLVGTGVSYSQEKMSMEEYQAQLSEWQMREADAQTAGTTCQTEVDGLKEEIATVDAETETVWGEILDLLGTDQAGVDEFRSSLQNLESQVDGLLALSPEELFKKREEIAEIAAKLEEFKGNKIAALTEMQNMIASIEGKLTQAKNKMPKAVYDEYTVVVGDYLWKISGKAEIYDDPFQWIRIYSYNKDQIKNADLIYPDQIFKIQREVGPDEYLVAKGDFLAKIAGNPNVLGDPAAWTKVYEKNRDVVGDDPNTIYPYQVLVIPRD